MNKYETIIIFDPTHKYEDTLKECIDKFKDMCQKFTGTKKKIHLEELGEKKLAYEIKGCSTGYYVIYRWQGTAENVAELERHLRITDKVIKFITVKREDDDEDSFELEEFQDITVESEQKPDGNANNQIDALDVMLGFADYVKKGGE